MYLQKFHGHTNHPFFLLRRVLASDPRHLSHCTSGYLGVSFGLRSIGRCISSSRPIRQVFLASSTLVELDWIVGWVAD